MIALEGSALHSGGRARVVLERRAGPVALVARGREARVDELRAIDGAWATTVARADGAVRVATVEHLFAALGGLGVREGLVARVEGDELPLLDGASLAWARAVVALDPPRGAAPLVVARDGEIAVGASRYAFARGPTARSTEVRVRLVTEHAHVAADASWSGDADDFLARVAPARTFAFARDLDALAARGLASRVDPAQALVVTADAILSAGGPVAADEPARHKLLDLVGDLYLYGGPPRGQVYAERPGHAATHAALARALADGILAIG